MRAACAAAVVVCACTSPPPALMPSADAGPPCVVSALGGGGVLAVGAPATVTLTLQYFCSGGSLAADAVAVEVVDPTEKPAAFSAGAPTAEGAVPSGRISVAVAFTPDRAGAWVVRARFEPAVGYVQQGFVAEEVIRDAGFRLVPIDALPADCVHFGLLASGTPVCAFGNATTSLAIGGQVLDGLSFAIDGDAVWAVSKEGQQQRVARFEPAVGFTWRSGLLPNAFHLLAAGGGRGLFAGMGDQYVTRVLAAEDGGFTSVVQPLGPRFPTGMALVGDQVLMAATGDLGGGQHVVLAPDGGLRVSAGDSVLGFPSSDDGLVWGDGVAPTGGAGRRITVLDLDGERPRHRALTFLAPAGPLARLMPQLPVAEFSFGNAGVRAVLNVEGAELGWNLYDPGPGFEPVTSATRRHAFARSLDGKTLKVIDR